jgi:hypothetical protein
MLSAFAVSIAYQLHRSYLRLFEPGVLVAARAEGQPWYSRSSGEDNGAKGQSNIKISAKV